MSNDSLSTEFTLNINLNLTGMYTLLITFQPFCGDMLLHGNSCISPAVGVVSIIVFGEETLYLLAWGGNFEVAVYDNVRHVQRNVVHYSEQQALELLQYFSLRV